MGIERPRKRILISAWLKREGFTSAELEIVSGISRQSMTAIKAGRDVRLSTIVKILHGARVLSRRSVAIEELFDFDSPGDNGTAGTDDAYSLR